MLALHLANTKPNKQAATRLLPLHAVQGTPLRKQVYKRGAQHGEPNTFFSGTESPLLSTSPHSLPEQASGCALWATVASQMSQLVLCLATALLKSLLCFHFAVGPAHHVASSAPGFMDPDPERTCWEDSFCPNTSWGLFSDMRLRSLQYGGWPGTHNFMAIEFFIAKAPLAIFLKHYRN